MAAQMNGDGNGGSAPGMVERVARLEEVAKETRARLVRMEGLLDGLIVKAEALATRLGLLEKRMESLATKDALDAVAARLEAAMAKMETRILKWFVGTLLVAGSLVFTAASFLR